MAVHQLVPSFVPGDATGTAAVNFQRLLRRMGFASDLYAGDMHRGFQGWVKPAAHLRPAKSDWVLYHHGIASPLSGQLMHLSCRRAVIFHNITPAHFYAGTTLADVLVAGRAQLAAMARHVDLAIGVSEFNCAELREAGFTNVHHVPLYIDSERFDVDRADRDTLQKLRSRSINLLTVSRVVPHKRIEDVVSLHAEVQRLDPESSLVIVGGMDAGSRHFRRLKQRAEALRNVTFLGKVSQAELVAAYHASDVFVSMSEHEGFGVPLLEAMAAGLPVMAYGAAAVPETMGGAGVVFDEKRFAYLAEAVREITDDADLREHIVQGQYSRLAQFSPEASQQKLAAALGTRGATTKRRAASKPRVGFIVQRFGEVTGGAEAHARMIVEKLKAHWDITVLTTCAKDHLSWANEFSPGEQRVDGVRVLRFPSVRTRQIERFNALSRGVFGQPQDRMMEEHWVAEQGPDVPGLFEHLEQQSGRYDGFVAFTYLYGTTAWGLPMIADRALLVPTAHDEPALEFDVFADAFERPQALLCNTPEEAALIERRFRNPARIRIVGVGVDAPAGKAARFRQAHGLRRPYLMYVGRMEAGKNLDWLVRLHAELRESYADTPDLVFAGGGDQKPSGPGIHVLGRISEQDKWDGLAGALGVVVPSRYESLSLLALEGFSQGTPLLANAQSAVLAGQAKRSGAGFTFDDVSSFADAVREIGERRDALRRPSKAFAKKHTWDKVVGAYLEEMKRITGTKQGRTER